MEFKKIFTLGVISGLFAFVICVVYTQAYYSILVDFSEGAEMSIMLSYCTGGTMAGCFLYFAIRKIIKNAAIANFIFNMIVSAIPLTLVFMVLAQNDIEFKNENASFMVYYYKGFILPMLFLPSLSWMTFKPLLIKE